MSNLDLKLIISAVDRATAPIRRITGQLSSMSRPLANVAIEAAKLSGKLAGLATVGAGMTAAFVKGPLLETAARYENLRVALDSVMGSAKEGQRAFDWINQFSAKTPLQLDTTTKAFMLLKNAGIDPTNGSLLALTDANAKLNGNQENMIEITRQLGQSWMKNKLQMEEINVLTERGIAVVPLLAKAMGKTDAAIMAMVGKGKIGRKEIALLFEAMGKDAAGAGEKQSKTWSGMMSTLSDQWDLFKNKIMAAGLFDWLKGKLQNLLQLIDKMAADGSLQKWANEIGQALKTAFEEGWAAGKKIYQFFSALSASVGGFGNLAKIVLGAVVLLMGSQLVMAIASVATGFSLLGAAIMAHPIVAIITAIAGAIMLVIKNWDALSAKVSSMKDRFFNWLDGPKMFPSAPSGSPVKPLSKPNETQVGGKVVVEVLGPGQVKLRKIQSDNPRVPLNVDSGLMMSGAH